MRDQEKRIHLFLRWFTSAQQMVCDADLSNTWKDSYPDGKVWREFVTIDEMIHWNALAEQYQGGVH